MRNLRSIFTPHRLLQVGTDLTLVGSAVSGLVGVMPAGWQNTALVGLGVLGKAATFIKSLAGNSRWETSPVGQRLLSGQPVSLADIEKLIERAVRWEMSNAAAPLTANAGGVAASAVLSSTFGQDPRGQDTTPPPAPVEAPVPDIPDAPLPPPGLDAPPPDPAPAAAPAPATGTQGQPGA